MYEQFKNDLLMLLANKTGISYDQIEEILISLDVVANKYEIKKKETSIVAYNQELPYLVKTFIVCKSIEGFSEGTLYNYTKHLSNFFNELKKLQKRLTQMMLEYIYIIIKNHAK